MTVKKKRKSDYVCVKCGVKYLTEAQKDKAQICTFFVGECGLCGEETGITHIRNYNYLNKKEMKATFEFDMNEPEDVMEHKRMSHALGMAMVLWEFTNNGKKRMENLIDNNTLSAQETLDAVYNMFHELIEDQGINIENLIQ